MTFILAAVVIAAGLLMPTNPAMGPAEPRTSAVAPAAITQQVLFRRGTGGFDCYRIPAIVRTKRGTLLAFAEARRGGASWCNDTGDIDLVVRRSTDGGATWGPTITVSGGSATETHGNPAPIVVEGGPNDGRIVLLTTHNPSTANTPRTPYVQYSTEAQDGTAWSAPVSLASQIDDPAWGWYATGPVHGIQLKRGARAGRLVVGINAGTPNGNLGGLVYSDDGGTTWRLGGTRLGTSSITPQEISPVELTDGRIYLAARNQVQGATWPRAYAISSDGGTTLSSGWAMVPNLAATPRVQGSTVRLRATDEGDRYNRILFATPVDASLRKNLTIYSSYNEGSSWQGGRQITADRSGYSDLVEIGSGTIGLLYEAGAYPGGDARDEIRFARMTEADLGLPDGAGGPTTPDASGQNLHAYVRGGATLGTGRFGQAVLLDCGAEYVQPPYAETLALGSGDFTITAWFRYGQSSADQAIFWAYGQGTTAPQVWIRAEPGSSRVRALVTTANGTASVASTQAYLDEGWHHVSLQRASGQLMLRIDGVQVGSAAAPSGSVSPNRPFQIVLGRRLDGANCFDGRLDEVRIYKRALTTTELDAIRNSNSTSVSGAVLRLPFETIG